MSSVGQSDLQLERPRLVGDVVLDWLREAIIRREFEPGQRLSEATLARRLGVSKTPVREALMRLRLIGLVTADEGHLRVVLPSRELIQEAYGLRVALESAAAAAAAQIANDQAKKQLLELAEMSLNQAQTDDLDAFRATDRDFHDQISLIAGNSMLSNNVARARDLCQALRQRDVIRDQVSIDCGRAHVAIASAIATRDEATASRQMSSHVEYVRDVVLCAFEKS